MPELAMAHPESSVTCPTNVTSQMKESADCIDDLSVTPEGFSDSDGSLENDSPVYQPVSKHTHEPIETGKRMLHTLGLKNGLFERRVPLKVYKSNKSEDKFDQHPHVRPQSTSTSGSNVKLARQSSEERVHSSDIQHGKDTTSFHDEKSDSHHKASHQHKKTQGKHHHHSHHHHHYHNHVTSGKEHVEKTHDKGPDRNSKEIKVSIETDVFDSAFFETIFAGQSKDNFYLPIMSPPAKETTEFHSTDFPRSCNSYYGRAMSFNFLLAGEDLPCNFDEERKKEATDALLSGLDKLPNSSCFCSSFNSSDESFTGWGVQQKGNKAKFGRRKKSLKPGSTDISMNRLTQTMGKDPVIFQHYKDNIKYIERYRFYHTVGNVGRPLSYSKYEEKAVKSDPYFGKIKSNYTSAMTSPFYGLTSHFRDDISGSASSGDSAQGKARSDDDSVEDNGADARPYSMRDRGKALNLAPVRECTVPNLRTTDKIDIKQLNKYLNLSTPPVPNKCLQINFDEVKSKRSGNTNEHSMFPASSIRRGARTLRLGSAEFVKPGTPDSASKWNSEKRGLQKSSTFVYNSVPGNLIVGSTVSSPVPPQTSRARSGGKMSPYVQFQKEHVLYPSTPPHHISGQGFKVCERVSELTGKERGKFSYTHAAHGEKTAPIVRTATAVDLKETYISRDRSRTITLDVNHLGIRGQQYKQREQIVLYKNRRAQIAKS